MHRTRVLALSSLALVASTGWVSILLYPWALSLSPPAYFGLHSLSWTLALGTLLVLAFLALARRQVRGASSHEIAAPLLDRPIGIWLGLLALFNFVLVFALAAQSAEHTWKAVKAATLLYLTTTLYDERRGTSRDARGAGCTGRPPRVAPPGPLRDRCRGTRPWCGPRDRT